MPVYIRKNILFTPPSLADATFEEDEDDFIQDPDQVRDALPQPFRMLDKVVTNLFDRAWDIISNRENQKIAEATRIRPPQYDCASQLAEHGDACCISSSPDSSYVFVGLRDGLAVIKAETQQTVGVYQEEKLEIASLQISQLSDTIYVISTIDDLGCARVFGFVNEHLYLVQAVVDGDGTSKSIVTKCESSKDGEYLAICFENSQNRDAWIEFHKIPRDVWVKEMEAAASKDTKRQTPVQEEETVPEGEENEQNSARSQKSGQEEPLSEEPTTDATGTPVDDGSGAAVQTDPPPAADVTESPASRVGSANPARSAHKFSTTNIVLKVCQPQSISGISWSTPHQAAKGIDSVGDVIGSGVNHLISVQHLEMRNSIFEQLREHRLRYLPKDYQPPLPCPTFHFVSAGRQMPQGMDANNPCAGPITAVMVWWSGHPQLTFYSLAKPAKDVEHKPDMVWPLASLPKISEVSPCTSLVAIALKNENIIIWDKYMGIPRAVHHMSSTVASVSWLDPSICGQDTSAPYMVSTSVYLMVVCTDGQIELINVGLNASTAPRKVSDSIEKSDELYCKVVPIQGIPELVLSCRVNGQMFLQDVLTGNLLCEICLPTAFSLMSPWDPVFSVASMGQMLYIRGEQKQSNEVSTDENENQSTSSPVGGLFVFTLRSFPSLDKYRKPRQDSVPYMVHSTVEKRVNALLSERISQQAMRKDRMQARWNHLKDELRSIQQMRDDAAKRHEVARSAAYPRPQAVH